MRVNQSQNSLETFFRWIISNIAWNIFQPVLAAIGVPIALNWDVLMLVKRFGNWVAIVVYFFLAYGLLAAIRNVWKVIGRGDAIASHGLAELILRGDDLFDKGKLSKFENEKQWWNFVREWVKETKIYVKAHFGIYAETIFSDLTDIEYKNHTKRGQLHNRRLSHLAKRLKSARKILERSP
jgi:hypothetical protein